MKYLLLFLIIPSLYAQVEIEQRLDIIKGFPCMKCHGSFVNKKSHFPLNTPHENIKLNHYKEINNCYFCHDRDNRNQLKLINGKKIAFNQGYKVCIQCHGEKNRDWKLGIHGKQVGSWSGKKYRYSCISCHEPHKPQFSKWIADPLPKYPWIDSARKGGH
ncbi:MAG: hypothetical protein DRQ88_04665 [Epsilonproteobacteria bacterium]|nr:MAG: hypothetical protein DRQ89_06850 [Campylobacterota bacterium]RLA66932.1 MAG: hypothetical protein DRQ88_04665 [Campylobacterota bacterium]